MSSIKEFPQPNKKTNINHKNSSIISQRRSSFSSSSNSSNNSSSYSFISQELFSLPNNNNNTQPSTTTTSSSSFTKGIPFSWETIPGIPKTQIIKRIDSSTRKPKMTNLPLPPPISTTTKHYISRKDPFYVALVECSKRDHADYQHNTTTTNNNGSNNNNNNNKSLSTRFGLVNTMSCKNSTTISESMVFLPRGGDQGPRSRVSSYQLLKKRSSSS